MSKNISEALTLLLLPVMVTEATGKTAFFSGEAGGVNEMRRCCVMSVPGKRKEKRQ